MSVRLEFVRQLTKEQFEVWKELEKMDDRLLGQFLAEMFNERFTSEAFVLQFRDLLSLAASDNLHQAIEGSGKYHAK